jgi:hypothetical protein
MPPRGVRSPVLSAKLGVSPCLAGRRLRPRREAQIQALDQTPPTLPMLPTTPARAIHDYEGHGTFDLSAALNIAPRSRSGRIEELAVELKRPLHAAILDDPAQNREHPQAGLLSSLPVRRHTAGRVAMS